VVALCEAFVDLVNLWVPRDFIRPWTSMSKQVAAAGPRDDSNVAQRWVIVNVSAVSIAGCKGYRHGARQHSRS
jgi:hypothetical protein